MISAAVFLLALPAFGAVSSGERSDLRSLRRGLEESPETFTGAAASPGPGRPVTGRAVFDEASAASGGGIFFSRCANPRADAVRFSAAVVQAAGGPFTPAAAVGRRHGTTVVTLEGARWEKKPDGTAVLILVGPRFGPPAPGPHGSSIRLVEGEVRRTIQEGEVVTVDGEKATVRAYPPEAQDAALDAAEALAAFDGLGGAQALARWLASRVSDRESAGFLLMEGLAGRVGNSAVPKDYAALRRASGELVGSPDRLKGNESRAYEDAEDLARDLIEEASAVQKENPLAAWAAAEEARRGLAVVAARAEAFGLRVPKELARGLKALPVPRSAPAVLDLSPASVGAAARRAGAESAERVLLPEDLYSRWLGEAGLAGKISAIEENPGFGLRRKSLEIRRLILDADLGPRQGAGKAALSAAQGGGWLFSAGGRYHSVAEKTLPLIKEFWAGLWTPEALGRRKREGRALEPEQTRVAFIRPPAFDATGIALTRDPGNRFLRRFTVAAVGGGLEDLFSGGPAAAFEQTLLGADGNPLVAPLTRGPRVLSAERLSAVLGLARRLDEHFGRGLELTFGFSGGRLILVDARPL